MFYLKKYDKIDKFVQKTAKNKVFEYRKCGYNHLYLIKENYEIRITDMSVIKLFYKEHLLFTKNIMILDLEQQKRVITLFIKMVYTFIELEGYKSI